MADTTYYLSLPYTKVLRRDEDGDVSATILELDGCRAHGDDESEALNNLAEAQRDWIEAALNAEQDIPLPEPEDELPSGKWLTRAPKSLHLKLNKLAKKDDTSLNQLVIMALSDFVGRREAREEWQQAVAWKHQVSRGSWRLPKLPAPGGSYLVQRTRDAVGAHPRQRRTTAMISAEAMSYSVPHRHASGSRR